MYPLDRHAPYHPLDLVRLLCLDCLDCLVRLVRLESLVDREGLADLVVLLDQDRRDHL